MGNIFVGDADSKARKINNVYVGIDGIARKVKQIYVGDENGIARLIWKSVAEKLTKFVSSLYKGCLSFTDYYITRFGGCQMGCSKIVKMGENLYGGTYFKSGYSNNYEDESTGLIILNIDNNGKINSFFTKEFYQMSGSNISPYGGTLSIVTSFGDKKLYAVGYTYTSSDYTTYTHYKFIYDYNTKKTCKRQIETTSSDYSYIYYNGIARAGDNGVIYLKQIEARSGAIGFVLYLDYNITINDDNAFSGESNSKSIQATSTYSRMKLYEIDSTSGILFEMYNSDATIRFIKYTINTSDDVTGINRLSLIELGKYKFPTQYYYCTVVDCNTLLVYTTDGHYSIVDITNNVLSVYPEQYIEELKNYIVHRIGNTNTFCLSNSYNTNATLVYVDTNNKTIVPIKKQNVGIIDHSENYNCYYASPFGDNSLIYIYFDDDNESYGYAHSIVDTFE